MIKLTENKIPYFVGVGRLGDFRNIYFRKVFLALCFFIFLIPFSTNINGDGISINYTYILFPVIVMLALGKIRLPDVIFLVIILLYSLVFLLTTIYQYSYFDFFDRRVFSFFIFISMFFYMFIVIDSQMVESFKIAIIAIAIYSSLAAVFLYLLAGAGDLGFTAKGVVGSQRFGFVYIMAICLLLNYSPQKKSLVLLKIFVMLVVAVGLILTFSRSGIVSILGCFVIYMTGNILGWFKRMHPLKIKFVIKAAFSITIVSIITLLIYKIFPVPFNFYLERLFTLNQESGASTYTYDFYDPESSEGFRVYMFFEILNFISKNLFLGSGFLGVWILFDDKSGSAHNQYLDVLFRTGILGFIAYIFLIYRLLRFLYLKDTGLYWGLIGILIYGFVHETFKLSHGAFILSFLLGMVVQHRSGKPRVDLVP